VYRLAQVSSKSSTSASRRGVPFAREYGGLLDNSLLWWGTGCPEPFYARGQTGQQLCWGLFRTVRQIAAGGVEIPGPAAKCWNLIVIDGMAQGNHHRNLATVRLEVFTDMPWCWLRAGTAIRSTSQPMAKASNATCDLAGVQEGSPVRQPCFTQIHPHLHPGRRELSVETER